MQILNPSDLGVVLNFGPTVSLPGLSLQTDGAGFAGFAKDRFLLIMYD